MHKNSIFLGLLALFAIAAVSYSLVALYKYYNYSNLTKQAVASSVNWSVKVDKKMWPFNVFLDDSYKIEANYAFKVEGKSFQGYTLFKENYLNSWAAEREIEKNQKKQWTVWYEKNNENHSTLQKNFPLKECVSAGVLWVLLLYFLWLGFYVATYRI